MNVHTTKKERKQYLFTCITDYYVFLFHNYSLTLNHAVLRGSVPLLGTKTKSICLSGRLLCFINRTISPRIFSVIAFSKISLFEVLTLQVRYLKELPQSLDSLSQFVRLSVNAILFYHEINDYFLSFG
jgi:hypothetical protein